MTPRELLEEVESWRRCEKDQLPIPEQLWADRMSVILNRKVHPGEIGRIAELIAETTVKHQKGKASK